MALFEIKVPPLDVYNDYTDCTWYRLAQDEGGEQDVELESAGDGESESEDRTDGESISGESGLRYPTRTKTGGRKTALRHLWESATDYLDYSTSSSSDTRTSKRRMEGAGRRAKPRNRPGFVDHSAIDLSDSSEGQSSSKVDTLRTRARGYVDKPAANRRTHNLTSQPHSDEEVERKIYTKEVFRYQSQEFEAAHNLSCHSCKGSEALLLGCQSCTHSYHQACLGYGVARQHTITKLEEYDYVFQCKFCVGAAFAKNSAAPRQQDCQSCYKVGPVDGSIDKTNANSVFNLLFRCSGCMRAYHMHHVPQGADAASNDSDPDQKSRIQDNVLCVECTENPHKIQTLVAWRPKDPENIAHTAQSIQEQDKEYLVKWKGLSYRFVKWMPGVWIWGAANHVSRQAFIKRNMPPAMVTEDVVPFEYTKIETIFDVEFNLYAFKSKTALLNQINDVKSVLVKFEGLGYDQAVWEPPPNSDDQVNWPLFEAAYANWVEGKFIRSPTDIQIRRNTKAARRQDFDDLGLTEQPIELSGGTLMPYQLHGINWLYKNWHEGKNVILADEMGLGKTVQLIGLMSTLFSQHKCWPFLVVAPHSTCPNWKREIQKWCPGLRVVTYYGDAAGKDLARYYELLPKGEGRKLQCHVVVTAYDTPISDKGNRFFMNFGWAGLIVDEGQRLKNDNSLLYKALKRIETELRVLVTGTPLQNSTRELYNLLQFLDDSVDAASLDAEYKDLADRDTITQLHSRLQPVLLRRTKAGTLGKQLPPIATSVVPLNMTKLEIELSKQILQSDDQISRAIAEGNGTISKNNRGGASNIVMALRLCMSHPHNSDKSLRDSSDSDLVEDSSKFRFLGAVLPQLKTDGHRVLIFSQFIDTLDMLETMLDGLGMLYARIDGSVSTHIRQKSIDTFNDPSSKLFAFLLSTRSGGVGINLATADTVFIMDPDYNPHQDIQAFSRAHRFGQTKPVLAFQLMVRSSVEEKILQKSRRKIALGEAIVEKLSDAQVKADAATILEWGAKALFSTDEDPNVAPYTTDEIEKLLDRSRAKHEENVEMTDEAIFGGAAIWVSSKDGQRGQQLGAETEQMNDSKWKAVFEKRAAELKNAEAVKAATQATQSKRKRTARKDDQQGYLDFEDEEFIKAVGNSSPPVSPEAKRQQVYNNEYVPMADEAASPGSVTDEAEVPQYRPIVAPMHAQASVPNPVPGRQQLAVSPVQQQLIDMGSISALPLDFQPSTFLIALMGRAREGPVFHSPSTHLGEKIYYDGGGAAVGNNPYPPKPRPCLGCLRKHAAEQCLRFGWPHPCLCGLAHLTTLKCLKTAIGKLTELLSPWAFERSYAGEGLWVRTKAKQMLEVESRLATTPKSARDLLMIIQLFMAFLKERRRSQLLIVWIVNGVKTIEEALEQASKSLGQQVRDWIYSALNEALEWKLVARNLKVPLPKPTTSNGNTTTTATSLPDLTLQQKPSSQEEGKAKPAKLQEKKIKLNPRLKGAKEDSQPHDLISQVKQAKQMNQIVANENKLKQLATGSAVSPGKPKGKLGRPRKVPGASSMASSQALISPKKTVTKAGQLSGIQESTVIDLTSPPVSKGNRSKQPLQGKEKAPAKPRKRKADVTDLDTTNPHQPKVTKSSSTALTGTDLAPQFPQSKQHLSPFPSSSLTAQPLPSSSPTTGPHTSSYPAPVTARETSLSAPPFTGGPISFFKPQIINSIELSNKVGTTQRQPPIPTPPPNTGLDGAADDTVCNSHQNQNGNNGNNYAAAKFPPAPVVQQTSRMAQPAPSYPAPLPHSRTHSGANVDAQQHLNRGVVGSPAVTSPQINGQSVPNYTRSQSTAPPAQYQSQRPPSDGTIWETYERLSRQMISSTAGNSPLIAAPAPQISWTSSMQRNAPIAATPASQGASDSTHQQTSSASPSPALNSAFGQTGRASVQGQSTIGALHRPQSRNASCYPQPQATAFESAYPSRDATGSNPQMTNTQMHNYNGGTSQAGRAYMSNQQMGSPQIGYSQFGDSQADMRQARPKAQSPQMGMQQGGDGQAAYGQMRQQAQSPQIGISQYREAQEEMRQIRQRSHMNASPFYGQSGAPQQLPQQSPRQAGYESPQYAAQDRLQEYRSPQLPKQARAQGYQSPQLPPQTQGHGQPHGYQPQQVRQFQQAEGYRTPQFPSGTPVGGYQSSFSNPMAVAAMMRKDSSNGSGGESGTRDQGSAPGQGDNGGATQPETGYWHGEG
ncbi:MAG: hypothetical protein M1814_004986 [Vezdaea aestivalis]|nr:MAG: hypothetical protein M1814_004986 [Vezdaea aestivalis]